MIPIHGKSFATWISLPPKENLKERRKDMDRRTDGVHHGTNWDSVGHMYCM
jgi:hypothetical protein